jgi:hypothetical protein
MRIIQYYWYEHTWYDKINELDKKKLGAIVTLLQRQK